MLVNINEKYTFDMQDTRRHDITLNIAGALSSAMQLISLKFVVIMHYCVELRVTVLNKIG